MIRERITHNDFLRIGRENEYFLWHFLQKGQNETGNSMYSIFDENDIIENAIKEITNNCSVPYYESYTEDSIDFLAGLGFDYDKLFVTDNLHRFVNRNFRFRPILIGFKKFTKIYSTFEVCYCGEGAVEILSKMNPKFIDELMENLQKNPE